MCPHLVVNTSVCFNGSIQIGHSVEIQGDSTHGTRDCFSGEIKTISVTSLSTGSYSCVKSLFILVGVFGGETRLGLCIGVV